jgi:hypothetical protein
MQMTIRALRQKQLLRKEMEEAAGYAKELLAQLVKVLPVAKLPVGEVKEEKGLPLILRWMVEAVKSCNDESLTPMAAVAGSFSDAVADYLVKRGATKVIVNNGGDIALRLAAGESTKVGIASSIESAAFTHILEVNSADKIGGIATSGLGGRSFTKGIASAAVALGLNSRLADACATLIGNHTYCPDPGIKQVLAQELDPDTDIPGHLVTFSVGNLEPDTRKKALKNGIAKAREFIDRGIITGAIVFVGQEMECVPGSLNGKLHLPKS